MNMAHIQNPHFTRGVPGHGHGHGPGPAPCRWIHGNKPLFNNHKASNNGIGAGVGNSRKFQDMVQQSYNNYNYDYSYNEGPLPKKRREPYFPNSTSNSLGLLTRRTEDESLCMPSLNNDDGDDRNRNNGLRVEGKEEEEGTCCSEEGSELYYSREAIERMSPSRRDGIDVYKETFFRRSYVSFLQTLGIRLQLPQTTIATAIVLCHRFFLRRSHATHDRFLIATASLFLAAKSEETPRPLNNVLVISYQLCHEQDLASFHYFLSNDWFEQHKKRVLEAEHMLLIALDFELTVQHPYKPLMSVLSKIGLSHSALLQVAWNFINEGLRSSLCLQFKPQHIAAGAVFLAAKLLNFDLSYTPRLWQEFQTTSAIIEDVVKQLTEVF